MPGPPEGEVAPFDGLRLLSVGHTLPGLYCIAVLRDLGFDVARVERLAGDADRFGGLAGQFPVRSLREGTARCAIDLKDPRGAAAFRRMAARADVVLEGFRPGTAARLGIDHAALAVENPRLIYVAISGYGQEGPWRDHAGHDLNYLAAAGALDLAGGPDGTPGMPGATYADGLAGLGAAINVLAALEARRRDGRGRFVDVAITDGPLFLLSAELERWWTTGTARTRGDTHLTGAYPWYGVFETADGRYLSVAAVEPAFYDRLCRVVGHPELADRQFVTGEERRQQREVLRATFRKRTRDEWVALLAEDACVAPVFSIDEAAEAPPAARARRELPDAAATLVRSPVRLPPAACRPKRGTAETLAAYGFSAEMVRALGAQGVIGE
ncbi:MAG TPA: CaiB/BaiF CoA-transferase family protein [Candidatus Binatia bacterium]|nr:CaiB/BaiF CoA-transferase family protein [Candidatus Binatia bacterium]